MADEQILGILLALVAACSWGCSSIFFKTALRESKFVKELLFSISIRGVIAVPIIGLLTLFLYGSNTLSLFMRLFSSDIIVLLFFSSLAVTIGDILFFGSLQRIEVSKAQPVASIYPLFTAILLVATGVEIITPIILVGIFILIVGISLVSQQNNESASKENIKDGRVGLIMAILAAIFWSFGIITIRLLLDYEDVNVFTLATIRFGILTAITAILWTLTTIHQRKEEDFTFIIASRKDVAILGVGGILGWGLGAISFFSSIDLIGASRATPISSINPLIAVFLGIMYLKEKLSPIQLVGILLVFIGSFLISIS